MKIVKYDEFLNENVFSSISSFLKNLFKVKSEDGAKVTTEIEKEDPIEDISLTDAVNDWSNKQLQVNNNLQMMATDISIDFYKNPASNKLSVVNEQWPDWDEIPGVFHVAFYYTFEDGRKVKMSYMPGGKRGIIIYEVTKTTFIKFDINSFTVNNWVNEFSKLRTFAK